MRKSVFDGSFYPSKKSDITDFLRNALKRAEVQEAKAYSYVAPHAGYIYSGGTAAFTYKAMLSNPEIEKASTIVIIGPNHTGAGRPISVSFEDWETPLGKVANDKELSKAIVGASDYISRDESAHESEHSIEVQLPFLQYAFKDKKFAFICMGDQSIEASEILADAILKSVKGTESNIIILASSDFNHYESAETAKRKDGKLLDALKIIDYKGFNRLVYELNDSACGFGPITVAAIFAKRMGATKGVVLNYSNSGDQTGDYSSVVAYSSIAFI